jgi:preprotein translocase subunit SecY
MQQMQEEDPTRYRETQERWTYYLAVPMAALNGFGQINIILSQFSAGTSPLNFTLGWNLPTITMIIAMTGGTMFAIWLGELISEYGLRKQGLSLIIFAGIVSRVPFNIATMLSDEQTRIQSMVVFVVLITLMVLAIVFVQQGRRNVPVMYPGRRVGNRQSMPVRGSLPLQVNMAGMIPIIFAQSILTFPAIIAGFFRNSQTPWVAQTAAAIGDFFGAQSPWYVLVFFLMVVLFTFFYTTVLFEQQNYGEALKRQGAQIPGITKGAPTQKYLNKVLSRITLPGALFLGFVAVLPFIVQFTNLIPIANQLSILSTGLLIVVGVVRDTFAGLDAELKLRGYSDTLLVK